MDSYQIRLVECSVYFRTLCTLVMLRFLRLLPSFRLPRLLLSLQAFTLGSSHSIVMFRFIRLPSLLAFMLDHSSSSYKFRLSRRLFSRSQ